MSGLFAAMLVVLGTSVSLRPPDLQVEASTVAGADLPELAEALARALLAGGARVVLRGPGSGQCERCVKVVVTEAGPGAYRVDVTQNDHSASTALRLPASSLLFDRARAIAIQTRMLVTWQAGSETKVAASRPSRKTKVSSDAPKASGEQPRVAAVAPASPPSPRQASEILPGQDSELSASGQPTVPPLQVSETESDAAVQATEWEEEDSTSERSAERPPARPAVRGRAPQASSRRLASASPGVDFSAGPSETPSWRWPWIPTAVGAGAVVAAGICAAVARSRYDALSDKTRSYDSAQALKSQGERWQIAAFVFGGVAVAGLGTGIVGFATGPSRGSSVSASVSPVPGGGLVAVTGDLP